MTGPRFLCLFRLSTLFPNQLLLTYACLLYPVIYIYIYALPSLSSCGLSARECNIYYTSYDLQRQYDTVNPHTHPDIMLRSPINKESAEPYWYAMMRSTALYSPEFDLCGYPTFRNTFLFYFEIYTYLLRYGKPF